MKTIEDIRAMVTEGIRLLQAADRALDELEKAKAASPRFRPAKGESPAAKVWQAYEARYLTRYGEKPVRNAMTNGICANLVARLGAEEAALVAAFFVTVNNSFYVQRFHPINLALRDAESLRTQMKTGQTMTANRAKAMEVASSSVQASGSYLQKKYGVSADAGEKN